MRKRTSPTILERAIITVPEFEKVMKKLSEQVTLRGQSKFNELGSKLPAFDG